MLRLGARPRILASNSSLNPRTDKWILKNRSPGAKGWLSAWGFELQIFYFIRQRLQVKQQVSAWARGCGCDSVTDQRYQGHEHREWYRTGNVPGSQSQWGTQQPIWTTKNNDPVLGWALYPIEGGSKQIFLAQSNGWALLRLGPRHPGFKRKWLEKDREAGREATKIQK